DWQGRVELSSEARMNILNVSSSPAVSSSDGWFLIGSPIVTDLGTITVGGQAFPHAARINDNGTNWWAIRQYVHPRFTTGVPWTLTAYVQEGTSGQASLSLVARKDANNNPQQDVGVSWSLVSQSVVGTTGDPGFDLIGSDIALLPDGITYRISM